MIGSLPRAGLGPLPDGRRGPNDTSDGGLSADLFAQLLGGAAQAPGQELAGTGGEVAAEGAPALPSLPVPTASAESRKQPPAAPIARVFNQDGFFGHAGGVGSEAVPLPGIEPPAAPMPDVPGAAGERPEDATMAQERMRALAPGTALARSPHAETHAARSRPFRATVPIASLDQAEPGPAPTEPEEPQPSAPVTRRQLREFAAARSPLRVAVSEIEQGLQVAARVDGLDETERRQLRDEIAALLARHGLSPARIDIFAAPLREKDQ